MDKKTSLRKRLASYSATAAAMTALTTHVTGQIYSGEKNIVVDNATVNIDLDNDGTNDFSFENKHFSIYDYNQLRSLDVTNNQWIGSSMVSAFGANTSFPYYSPNSTYSNDWLTNLGNTYFGAGNFAGQGDKYIAVRFSSSWKLGWIRINIPTGHASMTIRDWAYIEGNENFVTGSLKPVTSDSSVSDVTATTAKLNLTSNAEGTVYFAVQSVSVETIPTAAEIKAGTGFITSGSGAATANVALSLNLTGLSENTAYKIFYIVENPLVNGNISEVGVLPFATRDVTAPVLSAVSVTGLSVNGATAHLTSGENGTAYYAVLAASATAPTAAEIKTGTGFTASGNIAVTAGTEVDLNITGLSANTAYSFYTVVVDASDNTSAISKVDFSTIVSSVNELTADATVNLFPNPARGSVQISLKSSALYKIININGTVVMSGKLEEGLSTLDIGSLPEGNYYILVTLNGTTITKKLIVG